MVALPYPTNSSPGRQGHDGGGRLINCMAQRLEGALKGAYGWYRSPGLRTAFTTDAFGFRGAIEVNGAAYVVQSNACFYVTYSAGVYTAVRIGNIPGEKPVTLARNNRTPDPDVICVHEFGQSRLTPTSAVLFQDADLSTPTSVAFFDGYFFWTISDGRFFASDINSTDVSALDYAVAETLPDGLLRVVRRGQEVILFGPQSAEFWNNAANPVGMPLSRVTATRGGLIGKSAVTGWEDGIPATVPIAYVGSDNAVYALAGYQATLISTMDVQRAIEADPNRADIVMTSFVSGGVTFYVLQLTDATWVYDTAHLFWHERQSYASPRWRVSQCFYAFGKWLAGDAGSGAIYEIDPYAYREGTEPLPWMLETGPVRDFPNRTVIPGADFDFATGVGYLPWSGEVERNPRVSISNSDDGGKTWTSPLLRDLGRAGQFNARISVNRQGLTRSKGRRYRLEITDPVPVCALAGAMAAQGRAR
jgi:hypothetical protein